MHVYMLLARNLRLERRIFKMQKLKYNDEARNGKGALVGAL